MNSPKISIIIPSFNKGNYIDTTLTSIFNQKYKNIEVIIQDGFSTDQTKRIVKKYQEKYKNIYWESKKDGGQLNAINSGLQKASGEIVTFINADDCYLPNTFEDVAKIYLTNSDCLWIVGRGIVINDAGAQIADLSSKYKNFLLRLNNYNFLLMTNYIFQPSVFINRIAMEKYGPFYGGDNFVMEYDLWLKLGKIEMPIVATSYFSKFRLADGSITKRLYRKILIEDEAIMERYTRNKLIRILHKFHNLIRLIYIRSL